MGFKMWFRKRAENNSEFHLSIGWNFEYFSQHGQISRIIWGISMEILVVLWLGFGLILADYFEGCRIHYSAEYA